jgi:hypothetical protein
MQLYVFVTPYKPIARLILGNPYTLWTAAQAVFEQGQGGSS